MKDVRRQGGNAWPSKSIESVPIVTIDGLSLNACHFIKIDVEGAEFQASSAPPP